MFAAGCVRVRLLDEKASGSVRVAEGIDACDVVRVVVLEYGFQEARFVIIAGAIAAVGMVATVVVPAPAGGAVVGAADVGLGVTVAEGVGRGAGRFDGGLWYRFGGGMVGSMCAMGWGLVLIPGLGGLLRESGGSGGEVKGWLSEAEFRDVRKVGGGCVGWDMTNVNFCKYELG